MAKLRAHRPVTEATASLVTTSPSSLALIVRTRSGVVSASLPDKPRISVGRSSDCDVVIADASVSRLHAIIGRSPWTIEDGGSRHGTVILGQHLRPGERVPLPLGAVVDLGQATLVIVRAAASPAITASAEQLVVSGPAMRDVRAKLEIAAAGPLPILLQGETGTGKELFARAVHRLSPRADRPFVPLNCAALPEGMLESELFGHERGAFTGAVGTKLGLFEAADGGTLFLDEIGDLALTTQSKLLRVLESGELLRLGSVHPKHVDVRIVAATNRDVRELVGAQRFRADLYYRLNGVTLTLPPLRARRGDVLPLVELFARLMADRLGREPPLFAADALTAMETYEWPGNVRELRHVVERAVVMCGASAVVVVEHLMLSAELSASVIPSPSGAPERERIVEALRVTSGNQTQAAKALGISRQTLNKKLALLGVGRPRTPR